MFHTPSTVVTRFRDTRVPLNAIIYLAVVTISLSNLSIQQSEILSPKTEPFYIDLQHKFSSSGEFKPRGSVLVRPKTEYRSGQATFTQQQSVLSHEDLKTLFKSSEEGDTYYLRALLRKKKADPNDKSTRLTQTILKSCSLAASDLADTLLINLNPLNEFISLNIFTTNPECKGDLPNPVSSQFNTTIILDSGAVGPQPDTATYIKRLEEERQSKQREGKEDNRSFLAKYWIYIVPAVIILMMLGGPEQGAR